MTANWEIDTLENGLRVVTTSVPTAQSVSVNVFVGVGSRAEVTRTNGLSHYIEHMLFKGTERRKTSIDIAEAIEGAGGVLNAYTSQEITCYWNQVPFDKLPLAMDVLADMMQHSLLEQEEIDRERTVVQQEIRRAYDQPGAWASRLLSEASFGDQQLGWPVAGTVETVEEMNRQDFMDHIGTWYVPQNMVISVAGNTTHKAVVEETRKLFGELTGDAAPSIEPAKEGRPERNIIVEDRDITQSNLGMSLRAVSRTDPDRYPLTILNAVLGRGMSSRLFKEVRERRGLAYSIGSGVTRYNDTGVLSISAGVTAEHVTETTQVIKTELMKLVDDLVGNKEMTKARDYTTGSFRLSLESPMALAQRTGELLLMLGEIEPVDDIVERLKAVTAEDVQRVAQRLFRDDNLSMSLVGPGADASELAKALAA
ncbi:MAG: insulinase family protein [Chloroflexi bacterium]|nr:insulinase family protein [Chloroflexota bacterium]